METEVIRGGEGRREGTTEASQASLPRSYGADVPRPVCLGLAVRETFESLPSRCPDLTGRSGGAGGGGSVLAGPPSITWQ